MMNPMERYRGTLLGLAAANAVGTTLEFKPPGTFAPISDMVGGGPFRLEPGQWTDDTSMALCLAANLGDDADTTAAVYGQLAGAFYGEQGIPAVWREKLALHDTIESLADQLFALSRKEAI